MKTSIQTNGATTYYTKTINVVSLTGLIAQLTLTRKLIDVTEDAHKTKTTYSLTYNGQEVSSYNLNHKEEVRYFMNHLDKYANRFNA
jgi:hypothetical protein